MPAAPPAPPSAIRWWVCGLLFLATTLNYMDRVALSQMAKDIQDALAFDDEEYSWVESGFSFAFAVGAVGTGFVVDKVSVRWVYPAVVFGWSLAGVLTAFANGFWWLFGCRVALGLFEAGNWPCGIRTTKAILKPEERSFGNSLFQSGTAVGAIATPIMILLIIRWAVAHNYVEPLDGWRVPFLVIGFSGVAWIVGWFIFAPAALRNSQPTDPAAAGAARYRDIFKDRRFWALLGMVTAINISWQTYRVWFPKYLRGPLHYTPEEMTAFTTGYYIAADVGSWVVGLTTLVLIRRGTPGHTARLLAFAGCAGLAVASVLVPFAPVGWQMTLAVLVYGFAALGLFPTYFSMSQELSAAHQGKVTGTLGAGAHVFLALVVYPIQGAVVQRTGSYDWVLASAGLFPVLALGLMLWQWPASREMPNDQCPTNDQGMTNIK